MYSVQIQVSRQISFNAKTLQFLCEWGSQLESRWTLINPNLIIQILWSYQNSFHTAKPLINQSRRLIQVYFKTWSWIAVCEDLICWDIFQTRPQLQLVYNLLPDSIIYFVHNTLTLWVFIHRLDLIVNHYTEVIVSLKKLWRVRLLFVLF